MPQDISIVIVNYNVKAFLQQCLYSVYKAGESLNTEIFVIDNNSVDGSVEMIKQNFKDVILIENKENKGFAYACNQGIKKSSGEFILLLNPDTVIKEDSLTACLDFMRNTNDAGALGVKMINGQGHFLPESKRSLPTAKSAFFKMFGLSALFPKSKIFGQYQLRYLDENSIHEVEVLSGAFMLIRKSVLDVIGLLDEKFFMYGEDIDLSYRILKIDYKNYYFPKTTIIHYKGESTKKASLKYVKLFYNAMLIFANKHYGKQRQYLFRSIIKLAIYIRASLALIKRFFTAIYLPTIDFFISYLCYYLIIPLWEHYKFDGIKAYSENLLNWYVPVYIVVWQYFIYYFTNYKLKIRFIQLLKAIITGTIVILAGYSLLPENYRNSRALILFGACTTIFTTYINRLTIRVLTRKSKGSVFPTKKRTLLIGNLKNDTLTNYSDSIKKHYEICNQLDYNKTDVNTSDFLNKIEENINIFKVETIIFFINNISPGDIINCIIATAKKNIEFKIILSDSSLMIGPNSVMDLDKFPYLNINPISKSSSQILKRSFDLFISLFFAIVSPIFLLRNKKLPIFKIIWQILRNNMTWVSYNRLGKEKNNALPPISAGVFAPYHFNCSTDKKNEINQSYAKNYRIIKDIIIIFDALKSSINLQKHIDN